VEDEEAEIEKRMRDALKRALNTPHQPHKPKSSPGKKASGSKPKRRAPRREKPAG